jgi:hypothetical protein
MSNPQTEEIHYGSIEFETKLDQLNFLLDRFTIADEDKNLQPFAYEPRSQSSGMTAKHDLTVLTQHIISETIKENLCDYDRATFVASNFRRSTSDNYDAETYFLRYDVPPHTIEDDHHLDTALNAVADAFRPSHKIRPVHFADLLYYDWNLSTSAERPYTNNHILQGWIHHLYQQGLLKNSKMNFHNLFNWIFGTERTRIHQIKENKPPKYDYITMHQKTALVELDEPNKIRSVFGVPKLLIFAEAMFYWPLFREYLNEGKSPMLWGYETLNGGWLKLSDETFKHGLQGNTWISLDWKEFDMRFYYSLHRKMRMKQREYFTFTDGYIPSGERYSESKMKHEASIIDSTRDVPQSERLERLWNYVIDAVENTPCILPSGRVYTRKYAGQPSGIFTTQYGDSYYNATMTLTTLSEMGYSTLNDLFFKTMGDDIIILLLCLVPPNKHDDWIAVFSAISKRRFNAVVNIKKTKIGNGIHRASILSYINIYGLPYRSGDSLFAQLIYTKGFRDSPSRAMARAIGIAYACGPFNPDVFRCCKAIFDKFKHLGYSPNEKELDWMYRANLFGNRHELNIDVFPTQLEVYKRLTQIPSRTEKAKQKYWPSTHFHTTH